MVAARRMVVELALSGLGWSGTSSGVAKEFGMDVFQYHILGKLKYAALRTLLKKLLSPPGPTLHVSMTVPCAS